jgi:NTP pyrophosphatase (non-canonical NTP hydrolase)
MREIGRPEIFRSKPDDDGSPKENVDSSEMQDLKEGTPMTGVLDFSDRLTRQRNAEYLRTNTLRIAHLDVGGGEMLDTTERVKPAEKMMEILPTVAAKVALRVFTVLQGLEDKGAIIEALKKKFPESGCSYCGHKPCGCSVMRPEEKVGAQSSEEQKDWTIKEWQTHLKEVYGANNAKEGLRFIVGRLHSEIDEVTAAGMQMEMQTAPKDIERFRLEAISELADSFAWTIAVCNEVDIDLEQAFVDRYGKGCPNCGGMPCTCGPFTFVQERKDERTLKNL